MTSVLKRSNFSNNGNVFKKFVLTSIKKFDELNEKKSLSLLFPPNILPIEYEMLKVLENSTLSTAQRLLFYKNLLFSQFASSEALKATNKQNDERKSSSFSPWMNASKINKTHNSSIARNESLKLDENILVNDNDNNNVNETINIVDDDGTLKLPLLHSSSTPSSRLTRKKSTANSLRKRLLSAKDDTIGKRLRTKLIFGDETEEEDEDENGEELFHEARDNDKTAGEEMYASIVESDTSMRNQTKTLETAATEKTPYEHKNQPAASDDIYFNDSMEFDRSLERQKIMKDIAEGSSDHKNLDFRKLQYRYLEDPRKEFFNVRDPQSNEVITIDKSSALKRHQNKIRELRRQQLKSTPPTTRAKESAKAVKWITFEEAFKHT